MAKGTSGRESFGSFGRWLWSSSGVITFPARLAQTCVAVGAADAVAVDVVVVVGVVTVAAVASAIRLGQL